MTHHRADGVIRVTPSSGSTAVALVSELCELALSISEDVEPMTAVILDGGDDFFVNPAIDATGLDAFADAGWALATRAIADIGGPTVAVIRGRACGPAWELALACDLRIAREDAVVGSPEILYGRMPAAGGTQRLVRAAGVSAALNLLLTGRLLSGREAHKLGVVHRAAADEEELRSAVDAVIAALRSAAPIALGYAKEAIRAAELPLADGLRLEADLTAILQTTRDRSEGLAAFREKRKASFTGT